MKRLFLLVLLLASSVHAATVDDPKSDGQMMVAAGGKWYLVTSTNALPVGVAKGEPYYWDGSKVIVGPIALNMSASTDLLANGATVIDGAATSGTLKVWPVDTVKAKLAEKQDKTSFKTINGIPITGTGDIKITCTVQ